MHVVLGVSVVGGSGASGNVPPAGASAVRVAVVSFGRCGMPWEAEEGEYVRIERDNSDNATGSSSFIGCV